MDTFSLYTSTLKLIASQIFLEAAETIPEPSPEIIRLFETSLGLTFISQKDHEGNVCLAGSHEVRPEFKETFTQKDLLDYIYAIFHSSLYREKHKGNLEIDYQNIPIQADKDKFWKLVHLGGELRKIHSFKRDITVYSNIKNTKDSDYQHAQKWLQDNKKQELIHKDISQHQRIIQALTETVRIAEKIDILNI